MNSRGAGGNDGQIQHLSATSDVGDWLWWHPRPPEEGRSSGGVITAVIRAAAAPAIAVAASDRQGKPLDVWASPCDPHDRV